MKIENEFTYKRKYSINELYTAKCMFKNTEYFEFKNFDIFIKKYLTKKYFLNLTNIKCLIIPIEKEEEMDFINKLHTNCMPFIILYIKNINLNILNKLQYISDNVSILIDDYNVLSLKELLPSLNDNAKYFFTKTNGSFKHTISVDNYKTLLDDIYKPFLEFPYFSIAELTWDFYSMRNLTLEDIRHIVYATKYIYVNKHNSTLQTSISWNNFFNGHEEVSKVKFDINICSPYKKLYFDDDSIQLCENSKYLSLKYENIENESLDLNELNRIYGFLSATFKDSLLFVSLDQNMKCNKNPTQIPYLNCIISNTLNTGKIEK